MGFSNVNYDNVDSVELSRTYLEDPENPGSYTIESVEADSEITGCLRAIKKKAYDGVMYFALFTDRIEIHWRRDIDTSPIKVAEFVLTGHVYHNTTWYEQAFDFDFIGNPTEVEITVVEQHKRYRVMWTKDAFTVTNYFGIDFTFTRKSIDFWFFIYSPGKLVKLDATFYIRKKAMEVNRADGKGLATPVERAGVEPVFTDENPNVNWERYVYTHERLTVCEDPDGRTPVELFQEEAGLTVQ